MQSELKPCPFCGGEPNEQLEDNGIGCFWVICDNVKDGCGCEGTYQHTKGDAIKAWNRRAEAALSAAEPVAWRSEIGAYYHGPHKPNVDPSIVLQPLYAAPSEPSVGILQEAYKAGFLASTIGYNAELYDNFEKDPEWLGARYADISALTAQVQDVAELDERMKAAGMYTIAEMMGVTPLTKWTSNPAINTIEHFSEWLDRKTAEYLRMKAGYDLVDKGEDDELYEWVLAHASVFSTIRDQFRIVAAAPAKQEG